MDQIDFPRMHVSLYVKDIKATVDFYTTFFGQEADKIKDGYAKFILQKPSLIISFVQNKEKVNTNFGHLGFQVESKQILEKRLSEMNTKGVKLFEEIGTNCCYALQDKFWVSDPDGTMWEVYYFYQDSEFNDPRYSASEASEVCCTPNVNKPKIKVKLSELNSCAPNSGCC